MAGKQTQQVIGATRRGGRVVLVGASAREPSPLEATSLIRGDLTVSGFMLGPYIHVPRVRQNIANLIAQVASGQIQVVIDRSFALADAAAAHAYAEQRERVGRIVMTP